MILLLFGIAIIATLFYYYCIKPMSYWKNLGVQQTEPIWFFGDSWRNILRYQNVLELIDYLYYGSGNGRYGGCYTFTTPTLIIKDPELTKQILVKDFDHFVDHYLFQGSDYDPLWGKNLIALKGRYFLKRFRQVRFCLLSFMEQLSVFLLYSGEKWREMRSILSPCFTSSKMKAMFKLMLDCAERFTEYFLSLSVAEQTENQAIPLEMKETFTRYATDVVASTAFGVEVDSLNEPNNSFYLMGRRVTSFGFWKAMRFFMNILLPKVCAIFRIRFLDDETMSFFIGVVEETIKVREEKGIVRPDMIHLMMEARKGKPKVEEGAADDETSISHVDGKETSTAHLYLFST
ncbi:unnamed protein product [Acanthoscelides obtectus]|uniref:Cytochrome P450 n=1 Tax=Acanthoscelides obtectus TaxID=200917 RepID=A0A9P0Q8A3_ACAOB|nr:unnamed protein product [Acanthoscelides obtectus]CAK1633606.1 Cytochrome P450 9e2 [Acanthoscelides obtectus]